MPIYNLNNEIYDIPDDVVKDFERDNPDATISYSHGEDVYDIPIKEREGFLKQFPDAKLYVEQPTYESKKVGDVYVGGIGTQEEADAAFDANAKAVQERYANLQQTEIPDSEIQRLQDIKDTAQKQIDEAGFFDRFFDADTRAAVAARNQAEEAIEAYEEAKHANEGWFDKNVMGVFRGIGDKIGDLSTWDFGASGIASGVALNDVSKKLENGESLTASEQNMLDAFGLASAVQAAYQDKVGMAYKAGGSLPESAAFMGSLMLNPAAGVGRKIAESAAKAAVKKYGTSMVSKLAKGAARVGGDALEMAVATAVPGAGRVAEDYYNRLNGQSMFDIDENGIIRYGGQVDQEEADDAIWKAFGSQFIENYSESVGNYFAPMGNMISNLTSKGLKAAHLGKLADVVNDISSSQFSRGLKRFKDATKFDGFVGEYLEEVAGNFMNAATVGDMNFNSPEDPRSVFNPEVNMETALSCALMSGTIYAIEATVSVYNRRVAKKNLADADKAASELWGERWADMRSQMDEADPQLLAQLLTGINNATDLSDEAKQAAKNYATRLMQMQGYNARRLHNQMESTEEANVINNAYDEGAELSTPYDKHNAKIALDRAEAALGVASENADEQQFAQMVMAGSSNPVQAINTMAEQGYSDEQIQRAKDYYTAYHRMNGLTDALLDNVNSQIENANREVDANTNVDENTGTRTIIPVTLRDGRQGYVIQGTITPGEEGSIDVNKSDSYIVVRVDGKNLPMNPNKDLVSVGQITIPEALKEYNNTSLKEQLINNEIGEIDWNPATPNPKVGDSFEWNGESVTIVDHDGQGGTFVVPTEEWQAAQGNEKQMQKLVMQAQQSGVVPASEYKQWASDQLDAQEKAVAVQQEAAVQESEAIEIQPSGEEMAPVENVAPIGKGVFGDIYDQFKGRLKEGVDFLIKNRSGVLQGVLNRKEVGDIDLVWGNTKAGLAHIITKHVINHDDFSSVDHAVSVIEDVITNGEISIQKDGRVAFVKDGYRVAIDRNEEGNWIVTALDSSRKQKEKKRSEQDATRLHQSIFGEENGELVSPQSASLSENKDSDKNVQSQEKEHKPLHEREKEDVFRELGEKYGEKMPHKVEVTAKAWAEKVAKAQKNVDDAQQKLDDAPIGEDAKPQAAREKAQQELDAIKVQADFWAEMDAEIKKAQTERAALLNPKVEANMSEDPMNASEFVAQQLANGNITLTSESFKKETGYGETERKKFMKIIRKAENGGMTIEQAGERLMEMDRENGTNFFDQSDPNAGRDAIINMLGMARTWGDIANYIRDNRQRQAEADVEGIRSEMEEAIWNAYHVTPEEYATMLEMEMQENPYEGVDLAALDAIFAEKEFEPLNEQEYESESEADVDGNSGQSELLPEEQAGDTAGNSPSSSDEQTEGIGNGTPGKSEAAQGGTPGSRAINVFAEAERIDKEEQRRRPLRQRANEWSKALGVKVNFIERIEDVKNQTVLNAINEGQKVAGWFELGNGEVYFYMPNLDNMDEVDKTYIHEVVSHKGLPQLLGEERFNELCDKVWKMMPKSVQDEFLSYPGVNGNTRIAADEYIAFLSESVELTPEQKTIWDNIVQFFRDALDKALNGIISKSKITNEDISNLIKASYANLRSGNAENVRGEGARFNAKKKRALETASVSSKKHQPTVVSSADGAKILNNLDNLAREYEGKSSQSKTFLGDVAKAINARKQGSGSQYSTFETVNGKVVTIRLADHNAKVSNFDNREESEGISIVISAKNNNGITNDGDAHIVEYFYDSIDLRRADGKPLAEIVKSLKQALYSGEFKDTTGLAERQEVNPSRFRVVKDKNGRKSLVGLHNISEEKLRKAIKQGGLANPSMAVIDLDKQSHNNYGEITLIAPESLVDKKTGRNLGTYMGDAYTPVYPNVVKKMSDKGAKVFTKALETVDETFRSKVRTYFNSYLDSGTIYDALAYWYLSDTGKNPPILEAALPDGYTREEVKEIKSVNPDATIFAELSEDERKKVIDLYVEREGGKEKYKEGLAARIEGWKKSIEDENALQMRKKFSQDKLNELEEYGYEYGRIANYYSYAVRLANASSKPSEIETFRNAYDEVVNNGLEEDFGNWLMGKEEELGVEEKLFAGYDNQGRAKYLPNTLLNASKLMKKEGRAGATGLGGFNYFVAILVPVAKNTKQISAKKQNLSTQEEYDKFAKKWGEYYHKLALQLQPGADKWADYGYHRLHEIAPMANPKDYVKKEYGLELSDKFIKDLNDVKNAIKNDFPARYFETKFERPVYLNEFAAAVVPEGTSEDIVSALSDAGLPVEQYEAGNDEARMEVVDKVSTEIEGIRFRFIGERGARNLDQAEEATTRLDNLGVAREMESAQKDAKAIKMATGWERGADGKWRYEVDDNIDFELRRPHKEELKKAYDEANEKYYRMEMRVPVRIPKNATEEEKQRIKDMRKELSKLRKAMNKAFEAYYDYSAESAKLGEFLGKDNQLFKEYPELADYDVSFLRDTSKLAQGLKGSFTPEYKTIWLDDARPKGDVKSSLIHEIQHAIQGIEGFAQGGTPSMFDYAKYYAEDSKDSFRQFINRFGFEDWEKNLPFEQLMAYGKEYKGQFGGLHRAFINNAVESEDDRKTLLKELDYVKEMYDKFYQIAGGVDAAYKFKDSNEWYRSLSGEVESRNVQQRMGMTDEQRRNTLASETEDVAREDQIFLRDSIEQSPRFRISDKGRKIQQEVDKFTSKYNSKPVFVVDSDIKDKDLEAVFDGKATAKELREVLNKPNAMGGYVNNLDKIIIFADKAKVEKMENILFHENVHAQASTGKYNKLISYLYEYGKDKEAFARWKKMSDRKEYKEYERPEEFLAYTITDGMERGELEDILNVLEPSERESLFNLLKEVGYEYEEESRRRRLDRSLSGERSDKEGVERTDRTENGGREEAERISARERAERLTQLFAQVADMGLDGVLGNEAYDKLMTEIYNELPDAAIDEIKSDSESRYEGNIVPAVSDYMNHAEPNIFNKVAGIIRDALRKAGFDLQLSDGDVKYLLWRSRKPINRNLPLEVAEDLDARRKFGVDVASAPATRFRVKVNNKAKVRDDYESMTKKSGYQAREAIQDAMLSLRRFQELLEKATGKAIRGFENAWWHENRMSSMTQSAIHEMERKFYKPMTEAVKKLMEKANINEFAVVDYLMLKHGIERNREMAVRKALTDADGKIDKQRLADWYMDKRNVRNRQATPHLDTWRKQQEELDNLALLYGADMSRDYSGLTSMFDTDDVADCTERAYKEVEALENAHPRETEAVGKAVKGMTQSSLDYAYDSGLMDKKVYDELTNDMYDYYIPLRGFDETTSDEVYAYMDNERGAFNAPLRRAKGRSSKADNPLAYMKSIAESGIMQGNRNKMKQSFLAMVLNRPSDLVSVKEGVWAVLNPATGEWEAASVPPIPDNATPADVEAIITNWDAQMEQRAQQDPDNVRKITEADDVPYRVVGNRINQHQVLVKWNGKSYTLTVNGNPRLAMALNGLTNPNNTSNDGKVAASVQKAVNNINRQLAAWYTTRNPDFVASNFMRDTFYTNTIVRAKEGNHYANHYHKHYAKLLMPGKMLGLFYKWENGTLDMNIPIERDFHEFMVNGGETGYSNLKDMEEIKKQISKDLKGKRFEKVGKALEVLDRVNRAVENTARFAAFRTSKQVGRTTARAIFDAKEISVNFNKKGAGGTFYKGVGQTALGNLAAMVGAGGRALYVFFNAAIQGTTNLMHVTKMNPKGTGAGLGAMFLMGAVIPMLLGGDDEKDYYDLPEHVRRNHLIIPGGGDAWVSIPLPIEYRIMYGAGELLTSWRTGHEKGRDIGRKMLNLTGQALPLNFLEEGVDAFIPSSLSPLWQVYNNKSWTGLPIYKDNEFNKDDPEYTKAYKNVNRGVYNVTKGLYEWTFDEANQEEGINLNPAVIEHLAKGYFGGMVTTLDNLWKTGEMIAGDRDFDWRNIPIGNRALKKGDERTKEKRVTNEYFDNIERLDFLQSRERMIRKTMAGAAVPEEDKEKARKDYDVLLNSETYKEYMLFKEKKKVIDKLRKAMKEQGTSDELNKRLNDLMESANRVISE